MNTIQKQWQLKVLGFYEGEIDGKWGVLCVAATKEFQISVGLVADGIFGRDTERKSMEEVRKLQISLGFTGSQVDGFGGPKTWEAKEKADEPIDPDPEPEDFWETVPHFERHEFKCKCNGRYCNGFTHEPNHQLVQLLENVRQHFGRPVIVTSGLRCPNYNDELDGSSPNSKHMDGIAADIVVDGVSPEKVYGYIESLMPNCGGLGIYSGHVHVDVRSNKGRWDNR